MESEMEIPELNTNHQHKKGNVGKEAAAEQTKHECAKTAAGSRAHTTCRDAEGIVSGERNLRGESRMCDASHPVKVRHPRFVFYYLLLGNFPRLLPSRGASSMDASPIAAIDAL